MTDLTADLSLCVILHLTHTREVESDSYMVLYYCWYRLVWVRVGLFFLFFVVD